MDNVDMIAQDTPQKSIRQEIMVVDGKEYPVTITEIIGRNTYDSPSGQVEADEYIEIDWGPKLGISRTYGIYNHSASSEKITVINKGIKQITGKIYAEKLKN